MTRVHAGATLDRLPGPKYLSSLGFCELELQPPLPRVATAVRWREEMPGPVTLSLLAPHPCVAGPSGPLRLDTPLTDAVEWLADVADALDARFVVVRTPATVSPGARSRDRLRAYFERLQSELGDRTVVWEPSGAWEVDEAQAFGERQGLSIAIDPLQSEPVRTPQAYCRLVAIGARARFGEGLLETLLDRIEALGPEEAYVALTSPRSFQEAALLARLAAARGGG